MTSYPIAHVQNIGDAILEDGDRHDGDGDGHAAMLDSTVWFILIKN